MTGLEAVEYRVEYAKNGILLLAALATFLTGMMLVVVGSLALYVGATAFAAVVVGFGIVLYVAGVVTATKAKAQQSEGRWRKLWSRRVDYEDPPLEEWSESLEERNAFPVDGDD